MNAQGPLGLGALVVARDEEEVCGLLAGPVGDADYAHASFTDFVFLTGAAAAGVATAPATKKASSEESTCAHVKA